MSYRPSATLPRGPWGPTLDRVRRENAWSQTQAFKELRVGLGLGPDSRAAYVSLETGRVPSPAQHAYLVSRFGQPDEAPTTGLERPESGDALIAAIQAQTRAINELVAVVREGQDDRDGLLRALAVVVSRLAGQDGAALPERSAPRG